MVDAPSARDGVALIGPPRRRLSGPLADHFAPPPLPPLTRRGMELAARLGARRRPSGQNRRSERPTRGRPARLGSRNPTFWSKSVPLGLLQEARAKLARPTVKSERPGLSAGAFAFAACVRAFATRGCVRGGLWRWAGRAGRGVPGWASGRVPPGSLERLPETSRGSEVSGYGVRVGGYEGGQYRAAKILRFRDGSSGKTAFL